MLYILMRPRGAFLWTCSEGRVSKQGREGEGLPMGSARAQENQGRTWSGGTLPASLNKVELWGHRGFPRAGPSLLAKRGWVFTHLGTRWCPLEAKANTEDTPYLAHFLSPSLCSVFLAA